MTTLLRLEGLRVEGAGRAAPLVVDADLDVAAGESVGVVGESGSGKTMLVRTLLGIGPAKPGAVAGRLQARGGAWVDCHGAGPLGAGLGPGKASYVFQFPLEGLDPLRTVGRQMTDAARAVGASREDAKRRARAVLATLAAGEWERWLGLHPHTLSGGMAQRVAVAMALVTEPDLLVADEPTTGLDWARRRDVVDLLTGLRRPGGPAVLLLSHDLAVVRHVVDRVVVMLGGRIVEECAAQRFFGEPGPGHPYAKDLRSRVDALERGDRPPATVPTANEAEADGVLGCPYIGRCATWAILDRPMRMRCVRPQGWVEIGIGHRVRCHAAAEGE